MTRSSSWILVALASVVAVGAVAWAAVKMGALTVSRETLQARYALPTSRFVDIEGTRMHYVDEGSGPVVVLLPPSFMNLRAWDGVAALLAKDYRVIRLDFPVVGLSGPEVNRDYSIDAFGRLTEGLLRSLGISQFHLIGASSGGQVAFQYAARRPEQVCRLVVVNSGGLPRSSATNPNRDRGSAFNRWLLSLHKSRAYWEKTLTSQFTSGQKPPEWLVGLVYDLNRRTGLDEDGKLQLAQFRSEDPERMLGQVRAPALVLWGESNITLSHLEANVFSHWLTAAPSVVRKYPKLGHYAFIEDPAALAADMKAFLQGTLDTESRVTVRAPAGTQVIVPPVSAPTC